MYYKHNLFFYRKKPKQYCFGFFMLNNQLYLTNNVGGLFYIGKTLRIINKLKEHYEYKSKRKIRRII